MRFQTMKKESRSAGLGLAVAAMVLLSGCSVNGSSVESSYLNINGEKLEVDYVMKISGQEISLDEYRYYFLNSKREMDGGDDYYWQEDDDFSRRRDLKENTLTLLTTHYAIRELADTYGIALSSQELSHIHDNVEEQIQVLGGKKEYQQALRDVYLTDDLYRDIWENTYLSTKLYQHCVSEDGPFYIDDESMDEEEKEQRYQIKIQSLVLSEADSLDIEFSSSYDLISIETLR